LSGKGWMDPDSDLLGLSRLTALSWAATAVSLTTTLVAAYKVSNNLKLSNAVVAAGQTIGQFAQKTLNELSGMSFASVDFGPLSFSEADLFDELMNYTKFSTERVVGGIRLGYTFKMDDFKRFSDYAGELFGGAEELDTSVDFVDMSMNDFANRIKTTTHGNAAVSSTNVLDDGYEIIKDLHNSAAGEGLDDYMVTANQKITVELSTEVKDVLNYDVDEAANLNKQLDDYNESLADSSAKWGKLKTAGTVITALLAIGSIALTAYDLYRYYNVDYTPIPQYIVDEADITYTDADGSKLVTRNDTAYYRAVLTNRPESHDQYKSLNNYADLNGDAGKEWLALYCAQQDGGEPILADSFQVVTGSTSIPEGYTKGIHMFGSNAAANLTDSRYTYNDDLNGIYLYFKTEAAAAAGTASAFSRGSYAMVGGSGLVIGAALGAALTSLIKRKKSAAAA
ncbi:MAG: hypothetical protein IKI63_02795, partial [Clostridia bacterium]|nr:hypothetical protein [Clostridia bacterium]